MDNDKQNAVADAINLIDKSDRRRRRLLAEGRRVRAGLTRPAKAAGFRDLIGPILRLGLVDGEPVLIEDVLYRPSSPSTPLDDNDALATQDEVDAYEDAMAEQERDDGR